jgi:hypothetical protein
MMRPDSPVVTRIPLRWGISGGQLLGHESPDQPSAHGEHLQRYLVSRNPSCVLVVRASLDKQRIGPVRIAAARCNPSTDNANGVVGRYRAFPTPGSVSKVMRPAAARASQRWSRPVTDRAKALDHLAMVFDGHVPV